MRLLWLLCLLASVSINAHAADRKPNLIFILADDLGIGDLGCYGQTKIRTPNIDRLATEGMKFTQHYSGSCVCAPSRCTLMTGLHTGHAFVRANRENGRGYTGAEGQLAIPRDSVTVAKLLKALGYATGAMGKWGLGGPESEGHPNQQGFDLFYGYLCQRQAHTFYPEHLWRNSEMVQLEGNKFTVDGSKLVQVTAKTYSADLTTEEALKFVRTNAAKPFFLYLPYTIPHLALQVPEDSLAEYDGKFPETPYDGKQGYQAHPKPHAAYAAMVTRMDGYIGRLLALLKELKIDDNTAVFFSSDNGAITLAGADAKFFNGTSGLRGQKMDVYEGGIRTPLLARWPGKIKPGTTTDHLSAFWDLLPTFVELAGGTAPGGIDGISFAPTLLGKGNQRQHEFLYWEYHERGGWQAARMGNWKAVRAKTQTSADGPIELYDLKKDPVETTNVADKNPEVVAQMAKLFIQQHTPAVNFPSPLDKVKP
jgi:arylsulfatase A